MQENMFIVDKKTNKQQQQQQQPVDPYHKVF